MNGDRTCPESGRPDQPPAKRSEGTAARQVVDWFALTEDNLSPGAEAPTPVEPELHIDTSTPTESPALQVPSACSIGGLRP